jgi:hypothetical protein
MSGAADQRKTLASRTPRRAVSLALIAIEALGSLK